VGKPASLAQVMPKEPIEPNPLVVIYLGALGSIPTVGRSGLAGKDITTMSAEARLAGHTDWVHGIYWFPDGQHLASCGGAQDGTLRFWRAAVE
jgi:hypothetical protein